MKPVNFPARYIPKNISQKDKKKQLGMLLHLFSFETPIYFNII